LLLLLELERVCCEVDERLWDDVEARERALVLSLTLDELLAGGAALERLV